MIEREGRAGYGGSTRHRPLGRAHEVTLRGWQSCPVEIAFRRSDATLGRVAHRQAGKLLAATLALTARACRRMTGTSRGEWATLVIVVAHGFFLWLFFSGMETGLYLCILALLLDALAGWDAGPAPPSLIAAAAALPFAR